MSDIDTKIAQLLKESVDRNASLSLFKPEPTFEGFKLHMALMAEGWSREDIMYKIACDTRDHLVNSGYEPSPQLIDQCNKKATN